MKAIGSFAENVEDDPEKVLYSALGTFIILKAPESIKYIRNKINIHRDKKELRKYRGIYGDNL